MLPADILKALSDGGLPLMLFVMVFFLWRELTRSRKECEGQLRELRLNQVANIRKIAHLTGRLDVLQNATIRLKSENVALRQPPTGYLRTTTTETTDLDPAKS